MTVTRRYLHVIMALLVTGFFPVVVLVSNDFLITTLYAIVLMMGLSVLITYMMGLTELVRSPFSSERVTSGYLLIAGIVTSWVAVVTRIFWWFLFRMAGQPEWMMDHWIVPMTLWTMSLGGGMYIIARCMTPDHRVPLRTWFWLGGAFLIGIAGGLVAL